MSTDEDSAKITLRTVLGDYPHTRPLKRGEVGSPRLRLDFVEMKPTHTAFKPMVRELAFDVSEMAIVTYLQAKAYGKKLVLLPAVMMARFQLPYLIYNRERGVLAPEDLAGRRIGVRSYTQTTGAWVRGILTNDYGVDLSRVHWVTFEDAHVAEYDDPPGVERAVPDKKLVPMLLAGELDAVIGELPEADPRLASVFAASADRAWYERHRTMPINHMVVVTETLARSKPWAVAEIFRLLVEGKKSAGPAAPGPDPIRFGVAELRAALELIIGYSVQQGLIPKPYTVDELFDETTLGLGA